MRKVNFSVVIICPFDYCREDIDNKGITFSCLNCNFSELKDEKVGEINELSENSSEFKDFKRKYSHYFEE